MSDNTLSNLSSPQPNSQPNPQQRKITPIPALLAIGAFFFTMGFFVSPKLTSEHSKWPVAKGYIKNIWWEYDGTRHNAPKPYSRGENNQNGVATIEYSVGSRLYTTTQPHEGAIGDAVSVHYQPDNPAIAQTEVDPKTYKFQGGFTCYLIGFVLTVLGLLGMLYQKLFGDVPAWMKGDPSPRDL